MASKASPPPRSITAWLAKASAIGLGGAGLAYLAYRAHKDSRWLAGVYAWAEALSSASACSALLARDLHAYLRSDEDELPASLRQVLRLAQSEEVRAALSSTSQAVLQGAVARATGTAGDGQQDLTSRVLEAVLSDRGRGLVGMAVGLATKNATGALCEFVQAQQQEWAQQERGQGRTPAASLLASAMQLLSSEQGERLLSVLVTKSMKTAVSTYMESAAGFNPYDDLLASISKQGHRDAVSDIMSRVTAAFCREVAAACARASGEAPSPIAVPSTVPPSFHPHMSAPPTSHSHHHKEGRRSSRSTRPSPQRPPPSSLTPSSTLSSAASSSSSLNTLHQHGSVPDPLQQQQQQQDQQLPAHSQRNPMFEPGPAQEQQHEQHEGQEDGASEAQPARSSSTHIVLPPPPDDSQEPQQEQQQQQQQQQEQQHEQQHGSSLQGSSHESSSAFALASSNAHQAAQLLQGLHRAALHGHTYTQQQQHGSRQVLHEHDSQQQQGEQVLLPVRSTAKSVWVRHLAELAREQEVRTLCLDMVTSATREATYCTWEAVSSGVRGSLPTSFQDTSGPMLARQALACTVLVLCLAFFVRSVLGWRVA